jgi:short-subunit dehydrogenase
MNTRKRERRTMTNLAESTLTDHSVEVEVIKRDLACEIDIL